MGREWAVDLGEDPSPKELRVMTEVARTSLSVAVRLEHRLHPWTSFLVLFALANAGVELDPDAVDRAATSRVSLGIALGLVVGKLVGVGGFAWLAVRLGLGTAPSGASRPQLAGIAPWPASASPSRVSLFFTDLAFGPGPLQTSAKIAILAASVLASTLGAAVLWRSSSRPAP